MNRFKQVIEILDEAVDGSTAPVGGTHGAFWRGRTRDQFIALQIPAFGEQLPLLVLNDGASSNLVKALKGKAPFGADTGAADARYRRMPAGMGPVSPANISIIETWIDDGCPEEDTLPLQWRPTNAPLASSRTDDIWFLDLLTGWAVNSNGHILKTSDGGESWVEQIQTGAYLRCVGFANRLIGWVGTLSSAQRMFHTIDGGQTWNAVANLPARPSAICGLSVISESIVYASGTNFPNVAPAVIKTLDGGVTWTEIDMRPHATLLVDCLFIDEQQGWVVGGRSEVPNPTRNDVKPVVLHTSDGGQTWENRVAAIESQFPLGEWGWKIQFLNDLVGFVAMENFTVGAILTTTDGGITWTRKPINDAQGNANLEGIGFVDETHGWVGGWGDNTFSGGFSSETLDGGNNWTDANSIGKFINRFRFFGNPVTGGFASGRTVYKYSSEPVEAEAADLLLSTQATRFLESNEPTEYEGQVEIIYRVPADTQQVEIDIWDRFGAHICKLVDESHPSTGDTKVVWDGWSDSGEPVSSGSFIYRITLDGQAESRVIWLKK